MVYIMANKKEYIIDNMLWMYLEKANKGLDSLLSIIYDEILDDNDLDKLDLIDKKEYLLEYYNYVRENTKGICYHILDDIVSYDRYNKNIVFKKKVNSTYFYDSYIKCILKKRVNSIKSAEIKIFVSLYPAGEITNRNNEYFPALVVSLYALTSHKDNEYIISKFKSHYKEDIFGMDTEGYLTSKTLWLKSKDDIDSKNIKQLVNFTTQTILKIYRYL